MPRPFSWSGDLLDQPNSFAPPIAHAGHCHLRNFTRTFTRIARPRRREQLALAQGFARDREIGEKLRVEAMTNMGTGGAHRKADFLQRVFFFRGRRLEARAPRKGDPDPAMPAAIPHRGELVLQKVPGKLGDEQEIPARAVKGATDQGYVALSRGDALEGEPHSANPRRLLANEGARGADDAVDDRDVAGEQIRQLRKKKGRTQVTQ